MRDWRQLGNSLGLATFKKSLAQNLGRENPRKRREGLLNFSFKPINVGRGWR